LLLIDALMETSRDSEGVKEGDVEASGDALAVGLSVGVGINVADLVGARSVAVPRIDRDAECDSNTDGVDVPGDKVTSVEEDCELVCEFEPDMDLESDRSCEGVFFEAVADA
jgi:hypothetical protein